jgi:hypothetical protein
MTLPGSVVIKSTSDLSPAGILGYAKFIAAALIPILTIIVDYLPDQDNSGNEWKRWTQLAIAILGAIAVFAVPNAVKPVDVPPPAANVDPEADRAVPGAMTGVVDPPGEHAAPE